jgi:hypothetical protein
MRLFTPYGKGLAFAGLKRHNQDVQPFAVFPAFI